MYASRRWLGAVAIGIALSAGVARADGVADAARRDLLAAEAARFGAPVAAPTGTPWALIGTLFGATLVAAWFGTRLGLRGFAFGRLREKDGWREVTYRFRSQGPMQVRKDLLPRLEGLVGELEDLGAKVRRVAAPGEPAVAFAKPVAPVRFRREGEARGTTTVEPPARPDAPPDRAESPPESAAPPAPPAEAPADRSETYRRARRLLAEGREPGEVREATGLKLAEIDLLRAVPEPVAPAFRTGRPHLNVDLPVGRGRRGEGSAR
jgi:hypothetical protein